MRTLTCGLAWLVLVATAARAQALDAAVSVGVLKVSDARSEQALTGILEYQTGWFSLFAMPAVLHVKTTTTTLRGGTVSTSSSGVGDLPLVAAASHSFPGPGAPTLGAAVLVVFPTGNASCGLGNGQTAAGVDLGGALSPGRAHLSADVSRSVSGTSSQSTLNAPKATTLRFETGYDAAPRWTWTASLGVDVGTSDSTHPLSRVIGLGVSHTLAGALMLTVDGSRGLTSGSPQWVLSVGFGTAYGGSSPVTPTTPLRRIRTTFSTGGTTCR
jgi:hypothetical protein